MDLSVYYEDLKTTCNLSFFALCFAIFGVIFVGVRNTINKKNTKKTKIAIWVILLVMLAVVTSSFLTGATLAKKDIEQKTIYGYEGVFEIVEVSRGFNYEKAVFRFDNQEITLKYGENEYSIAPGKYNGKLVYGQHMGQILYLDTGQK